MNTVGTASKPIESKSPVAIATAVVKDQFASTYPGCPPVIAHHGRILEWAKNRWLEHPPEWLEDVCWRCLGDAHFVNSGGHPTRYMPSISSIKDVCRAITSSISLRAKDLPYFIGSEPEDVAPEWKRRTIAFDDYLVTLTPAGAKPVPRTQHWVDPSILTVEYDPSAECPIWMHCLKQWSQNDQKWQDLLQEWFGYCLMRERHYARWLMMHGKARAGKGIIAGVVRKLLGNSFRSTSLNLLTTSHGLEGLQNARIISIPEISRLQRGDNDTAAMVIKTILGQDPMDINPKGRPIIRNVVMPAAVMMQGNEIPNLSNRGQGISSKMMGLPFEESFLGVEDHQLPEKLEAELKGIAAWAVVGADRLERNIGKFTLCERSLEVQARFLAANNPLDTFLKARFVQNKRAFTQFKTIWKFWQSWVEDNGVRDFTSRNRIFARLESESSWYLRRGRRGEGARGFWGLSPRYNPDDESTY